MADTSTAWNPTLGRGDWALSGALLATGNDLETSVLISLFTDRQAADDDEIPDGTTDARGWWGDLESDSQIGSRLWLLAREKQTSATLQRAYDYIVEALQWLIDDGVVARFDVKVEWTALSRLGALITAYRNDGTKHSVAYQSVWSAIT